MTPEPSSTTHTFRRVFKSGATAQIVVDYERYKTIPEKLEGAVPITLWLRNPTRKDLKAYKQWALEVYSEVAKNTGKRIAYVFTKDFPEAFILEPDGRVLTVKEAHGEGAA